MKQFFPMALALCLICLSCPAFSAPVGNIADPFVMKKGVFFEEKRFGFILCGESENGDKSYFTQERQAVRIEKNGFTDITLVRTLDDGTTTRTQLSREGNTVLFPRASSSAGTFTLELKNGVSGQTAGQLGDDLPSKAADMELNYAGIKLGMTYKDMLFVYGRIGSGSIKKHYQLTYPIIETQGMRLASQNGEAFDDTTTQVIENLTYDWANSSRTLTIDKTYETDNDMIWGMGITAVMYQTPLVRDNMLRVGFDACYRKIDLKADDRQSDGTTWAWDADEYQFAVELSYQINDIFPYVSHVIPYLGMVYTHVSGTETHSIQNDVTTDGENVAIPLFRVSSDIEMDESIGFATGISMDLFNKALISVEKRIKDEDSFELAILIKF